MNEKENIRCPNHPEGQECSLCDGTGFIYIGKDYPEVKVRSNGNAGYNFLVDIITKIEEKQLRDTFSNKPLGIVKLSDVKEIIEGIKI